jgi:hypothetical protein
MWSVVTVTQKEVRSKNMVCFFVTYLTRISHSIFVERC